MKKKLLLWLFLSVNYLIHCQKNQPNHSYQNFDKVIDQRNTDLSYGIYFKDKYRKKGLKNHNYYKVNDFRVGKINYRDQLFEDILIKYDLIDDDVIILITKGYESSQIRLHKSLIEKFSIGTKEFFNNSQFGFLEKLLTAEKITLFKKHKKRKHKQLDNDFKYFKFTYIPYYLINYNNKSYVVKKSKDFINVFPDQKKIIKQFFKDENKLRKKDYEMFLISLCKKIDNNL